MASARLQEKLNAAIAREIGVSVQYMWQHVMAVGLEAPAVRDIFKKFAIVEMKHAEKIAERLNNLGGQPTTKPTPINVGKDLKEMLKNDLEAEQEAVKLYREIVDLAQSEKDYVTAQLFVNILADEEAHEAEFKGLLGM